nr:Crp/Fnr family transcriptional regulator [uncultured Desulfuromonas sp.]
MSGSVGELTQLPLLKGVSATTLQSVIETAKRRYLPKKGVMLSSEDLSQRLFVLLEGQIKVLRPSVGGDESLQQRLGEGDVFCLVSMVSGAHCGSYGESMGPCTLLSWPHRVFIDLMEKDRNLHVNVLNLLAQQVEVERHKRCLSQCSNVGARVAGYLLYLDETRCCRSESIDVRPITLSAQELGMARETMSRTFSAFERSGIVKCCRGLVKIHDHERLQMIADGMECECGCETEQRKASSS